MIINISDNQILELWKIKIRVYALRETNWIKKNVFAPIIMIFIAFGLSQFNLKLVPVFISFLVIYLVLSFVIFKKIKNTKRRNLGKLTPYPLIALLFSVFDLISLTMLTILALLIAILAVHRVFIDLPTLRWLIFFLFMTVVASILLSPTIVNNKSLSRVNNKNQIYLPLTLSTLNLIPSMSIFIYALLIYSQKIEAILVLISILSFLGGIILLPYVIAGYYETVVLTRSRWPHVEKSGSDFVFFKEN